LSGSTRIINSFYDLESSQPASCRQDAPNTITAKAGERIGLLIAPDAVRLLPSEN